MPCSPSGDTIASAEERSPRWILRGFTPDRPAIPEAPRMKAGQRAALPRYAAHGAAQAAAQSARQARETARVSFVKTLRAMAQRLRASAEVDDAERVALGITVPDTTPTPVGTPTTRPVVTVDTGRRLSQVIGFADEATPTRKGKPSGLVRVELWVKIGDPPPTDPNELKFLGLATRTP